MIESIGFLENCHDAMYQVSGWTPVTIPEDRSIASYEQWLYDSGISKEDVYWVFLLNKGDVIFFKNGKEATWFILNCL